jgi:hypothetical protein
MPQPIGIIATTVNISNIPRKTKVAIIREEYISITGRYEQALILNQFMYWTERVYDFDKFIIEENARKENNGFEDIQEMTHGWIYKTAAQLADELMTGWSASTTRVHLKKLIEAGFIEERVNPKYKWNQTRQYRVNLNAVEEALFEKGYSIPNFTVTKAAISKIENQKSKIKLENLEIKNVNITEITSEIKNNDYNKPVTKATSLTSTTSPPSAVFSNEFLKELADLVIEKNQSPMVNKLIEKEIETHSVENIKLCIQYANAKSKGDPIQYKAFLGKTITNGWAEGYDPKSVSVDNAKIEKDRIFLESRRQMPTFYLKMDAEKGCKASAQVLKERAERAAINNNKDKSEQVKQAPASIPPAIPTPTPVVTSRQPKKQLTQLSFAGLLSSISGHDNRPQPGA